LCQGPTAIDSQWCEPGKDDRHLKVNRRFKLWRRPPEPKGGTRSRFNLTKPAIRRSAGKRSGAGTRCRARSANIACFRPRTTTCYHLDHRESRGLGSLLPRSGTRVARFEPTSFQLPPAREKEICSAFGPFLLSAERFAAIPLLELRPPMRPRAIAARRQPRNDAPGRRNRRSRLSDSRITTRCAVTGLVQSAVPQTSECMLTGPMSLNVSRRRVRRPPGAVSGRRSWSRSR